MTRTALLVEDDPTTSKSIEMMLSHANLNVYATDMGEEGIDLGGDSVFSQDAGTQAVDGTDIQTVQVETVILPIRDGIMLIRKK